MSDRVLENPLAKAEELGKEAANAVLTRATVTGMDGDQVLLKRVGAETEDGQSWPQLLPGVTTADDVVAAKIGEGLVVLGRVGRVEYTEPINVKDFGALGDGVTDDTVALQAAIAYAYSQRNGASGGRGALVFFPSGVYITQKLTLYSNVILRGSGVHTTILKLKSGSNSALITSEGFQTGDANGGVYMCGIEDMLLDGNYSQNASNSDSGTVQIYGYNWFMNRVKISYGRSVGLYTNWGSSASSPGPYGVSMAASLQDVEVTTCLSTGIYWNGPHDSVWHNVMVHDGSSYGVYIYTRGNGLIAIGCHVWGTGQNYAWYIYGAACMLIGCQGEGASTRQVWIAANDQTIMGGHFFAGGGGTTGIEIANNAAGLNINTKVSNCTTAALLLTSDGGGSRIALTVYGSSGATVSGTQNASTDLRIVASGGQLPNAYDRHPIGTWARENITASLTDSTVNLLGGATGGSTPRTALPMWRTGSLTSVIVRSNANRVAGTLTIKVTKNGVATALTAVLDGTNPTFKASYSGIGAITYAIGDEIGCTVTTDGSWSPVTADITVVIETMDG